MLRKLYNSFLDRSIFGKLPKPMLPLTKYGMVDTSARFGSSWMVVMTYNTDPNGKWVDFEDNSNQTFHGPFFSENEAQRWMEDYPDDKDIKDCDVYILNNVR